MSTEKLDAATLRRLSVRFEVDPRTIKKLANGKEVVGMAGERARKALQSLSEPEDVQFASLMKVVNEVFEEEDEVGNGEQPQERERT